MKPDNILWLNETTVQLIDFGFSKEFKSKVRHRNTTVITESKMTTAMGNPYFQAPEVLTSSVYTHLCDVWSLGVVTYYLLQHHLPFSKEHVQSGKSRDNVTLTNIRSTYGVLASSFVRCCLRLDPKQRLSAEELLDHGWLQQEAEKPVESEEDLGSSPEVDQTKQEEEAYMAEAAVIRSMTRFHLYPPLKRASLLIVAFKLPSHGVDIMELREQFEHLDTKKSGQVSFQAFSRILAKHGVNSKDITSIFDKMRQERKETFNIVEFLASTIETKRTVTVDLLPQVFDHFDQDRKGYICKKDLGRLLGNVYSKVEVASMLKDADFANTGKITLSHFLRFMDEHARRDTLALSESEVDFEVDLSQYDTDAYLDEYGSLRTPISYDL